MRRLLGSLLAVLVPASLLVLVAPPAAADGAYSPPVDGPVVDGWRPPPSPFAAGNRGIDLDAAAGDAVRAAGDGVVVFAGRIGLDAHVVVLHADGLRTSYSFLDEVGVARGDAVERGQVVGTAGGPVHFGARAGDRYVDPSLLLSGGAPAEVRLIPAELRRPRSEGEERFALVRSLVGVARRGWRAGQAAVAWVADGAAVVAGGAMAELDRWAIMLDGVVHLVQAPISAVEELWAGLEYRRDQEGCTPGDRAPPPPADERRIAVLVGGYGSASGDAAVLDVDTRALGYADGDVAQFSYAGGQAPGARRLAGVTTTTYEPTDTTVGVTESARRLRALLTEIRLRHPGVPVDVIGHSLGGVVAVHALGHGDDLDPRVPTVGSVITLGSPHEGTELATAGSVVSRTGLTDDLAAWGGIANQTVDDLAETSDFMRWYRKVPPPDHVRFTSIAAEGDLVVPATHSILDPAATHSLVPLDGATAHDRLPGSAEAHREIALALAGMGPTCRSVLGGVGRAVGISFVEDLAGAAVTGPLVWYDRPVKSTKAPRSPGWPQAKRSPSPAPPR